MQPVPYAYLLSGIFRGAYAVLAGSRIRWLMPPARCGPVLPRAAPLCCLLCMGVRTGSTVVNMAYRVEDADTEDPVVVSPLLLKLCAARLLLRSLSA